MAILQLAGVVSILPFMVLASDPNAVETNSYLQWAYQSFSFTSTRSFLISLGVIVLVAIAIANLVSAFTSWFQQKVAWEVSHQLSRRLLKVYLEKPYKYYLKFNTSDLMNNTILEVGILTNGLIIPLLELIAKVSICLVIFALLTIVNPTIALTTFGFLGGAYALIYWGFRKHLRKQGLLRKASTMQLFRSVKEMFSGIKTLRVYGTQDFFYHRFENASKRIVDILPRVYLISSIPRYFMEIVAFGGILGITLFLLISEDNLQSSIPLLSLYALAGYRLLPAFQGAYNALSKIKHNINILDSLYEDLKLTKPAQQEKSTQASSLHFKESIAFEDISFSYNNDEQKVLKNLNISISKGKTIAIVGQTGAGKTTLIDILVGLLFPQQGQFIIDGEPLKPDNVQEWQKLLSYVPQDVFLFDDTIARNIAIGESDEKINMDLMHDVARVANIHDFITTELPDSYQTIIGEGGIRLSGGQRQRLGLARALYRQPELLILDEATSALDNITEKSVIDSLKAISKDLTVVIIAHRLSTVRHADKIYLIESGTVVDQGSYDKLLKNNPIFREMVHLS